MTVVDNRVARMSFDNKDFERGLSESAKSLASFDSQLSKAGSSGSNFSGIGDAIGQVSGKFSLLGTIGVGALLNIGAQAVMTGQQMLKSLAIDPIMAGYSEYELKINSIKTMLASGKTAEGLPVTLDMVNKKLGELNTYSDKTIYNFSDMTSNIGKFTNAGVDLDTAVLAIKGIANAAALSGSNAGEASRAMYNFSQALSKGYVQLIDWKSIELANMGTVEFKTQLLEAAVATGSLTKAADGMYQVLKPDGTYEMISATKGFNDSLTYQWMTTAALTTTLKNYSDETTDIGKRATEAATKVRTFSQLMDTTKESIQSGWAETFELVIGDYDQAGNIFTALSGIIGGMVGAFSDARNGLLKTWAELNGREAIITGLSKAFELLKAIIKPVAAAFEAVFSPITGKILANISKDFAYLMTSIKFGPDAAVKLRTVFQGLFSLLSLGGDVLLVVFESIKMAITPLLPLGGSLADLAVKIGQFFIDLKAAADKGQFFEKVTVKIGEGITAFYKKVQEGAAFIGTYSDEFAAFVVVLKKGIEDLKKVYAQAKYFILDFTDKLAPLQDVTKTAVEGIKGFYKGLSETPGESGTNPIIKGIMGIVDALSSVIEKFKSFDIFQKIKDFYAPILEFLKPVGETIAKTFETLKTSLVGVWRTEGFTGLLDLLNLFLAGGIYLGIQEVLKNFSKIAGDFSEIAKTATGFMSHVTGILDGVKDSLKAYQDQLKSKVLLTIAMAIGILAVSVIALSMVDPKKLTAASIAMAALLAELSATVYLLGKGMNGIDLGMLALQLIGFSVAVLILSTALVKIAALPADRLLGATTAITALLLELVGAAKLMQTITGFGAAVLSLIGLGIAIQLIVVAVQKLGNMDPKTLTQGLIAISEVAVGIGTFVGVITRVTNSGTLLAAGAAMGILGNAMLVFSASIVILGRIEPDKLTQALVGFGVILAELLVFSTLISNGVNPVALGAASLAMIAMGVALTEMATVVAMLGNLNPDKMVQGLAGIGAAVGIMVAAMLLTSNPAVLLGATAMIIMAASLALLTPTIVALGLIPLENIGIALLALVGVFTVLGVAGLVLGPVIPVLLGFGAAIALLGVGFFAIGAGMALFGTGLVAMAAGGGAAVGVMTLMLTALINLIPFLLTKVGEGIIKIAEVITKGAPAVGKAIVAILTTTGDLLITEIPKFIGIGLDFIETLLLMLLEKVPAFTDSGMKIILGFLKGVSDNIAPVIDEFLAVIVGIMDGITGRLPELSASGAAMMAAWLKGIGENAPVVISAGYRMIVDFINGLADAVEENLPLLLTAVGNLCNAFMGALYNFFIAGEGGSGKGNALGANILQGIIAGVTGGVSGLVVAIIAAGQALIDGFKNLLGINSPSTVMLGFGANIIEGLSEGINSLVPFLLTTVTTFVTNMITTIRDRAPEFQTNATELMTNFINGVTSKISEATTAIRGVIDPMLEEARTKISSFVDIGKNLAEGIIEGIEAKINDVVRAVQNLAGEALDGIRDFLGIASPSKAFAEIGQYCATGMSDGIASYSGLVTGATNKLGKDSLTSLRAVMNNLTGVLESDVDNTMVITPVLDLSGIESGRGTISSLLDGAGGSYSLAQNVSRQANAALVGGNQNGGNSTQVNAPVTNNFTISGLVIRGESDINAIAEKLYQKQMNASRGKGLRLAPSTF